MAKDPAFLFYANDFEAATKFFTYEEVGVYIRILITQFQHGHLTRDQILFVTNKWYEKVMEKFKIDSIGRYYNDRLDLEIHRRQAYSESRRKNIGVRYGHTYEATHEHTHEEIMKPHMETETETKTSTEIRDKKRIVKERKRVEFVPPTRDEFVAFFVEKGFPAALGERAYDGYATPNQKGESWIDSQGKKIRNWKQKAIHVWMKEEAKGSGNGILSKSGMQTLKNSELVIQQLKNESEE